MCPQARADLVRTMELQIARKQRLLDELEAACASGDETLRASAALEAASEGPGAEGEAMDTSPSAAAASSAPAPAPELAAKPAAAVPPARRDDDAQAQLAEMLGVLDAVPG